METLDEENEKVYPLDCIICRIDCFTCRWVRNVFHAVLSNPGDVTPAQLIWWKQLSDGKKRPIQLDERKKPPSIPFLRALIGSVRADWSSWIGLEQWGVVAAARICCTAWRLFSCLQGINNSKHFSWPIMSEHYFVRQIQMRFEYGNNRNILQYSRFYWTLQTVVDEVQNGCVSWFSFSSSRIL